MSRAPRRVMRGPLAKTRAALAAAAIIVGVTAVVPLAGLGSTAASASASASTGTTYPVTIDAANGNITIAHKPTSVISLSATGTEMLFAIGAGHQVRAVDTYSDYPKNAPRTKLSAYQPNVEAIVAYKPDLVVVAGDTTGLTTALAKFGIPVLSEPAAATLAQAYAQYVQLGTATDHVNQARAEVSKVRGQLAQIVKSVPKPAHAGSRTYYWELDQTYYSATSATFIGQLLGSLGMTNIADAANGAAASGGYPQLSAEFIIKANPSYMFLADTICCGQSARTVAKRPGWSTLAALKDGHVVALNDDIASHWGPRTVNLLRAVAAALTTHSHT